MQDEVTQSKKSKGSSRRFKLGEETWRAWTTIRRHRDGRTAALSRGACCVACHRFCKRDGQAVWVDTHRRAGSFVWLLGRRHHEAYSALVQRYASFQGPSDVRRSTVVRRVMACISLAW